MEIQIRNFIFNFGRLKLSGEFGVDLKCLYNHILSYSTLHEC